MKKVETASLWLMGAFYVLAGMNHFRAPEFYLPIMPPYLPWHAQLVFLSGVAEVIVGVGLLMPRTRVLAAWAAIALLLAVYPANIHMALADVPVGDPPQSSGSSAGSGCRCSSC
jgi:uncharacterized membrane protein